MLLSYLPFFDQLSSNHITIYESRALNSIIPNYIFLGTGKTLCARAIANRTDACFIRVIGSELVQKYVGEGARMVRELFELAKTKKACIIFFDEIDAIGGARFDDGQVKA